MKDTRFVDVELSFDGEPQSNPYFCDHCGEPHPASHGKVFADLGAHASYWVAWYPHENETFVDAVIGSWVSPDYSDHLTFRCRVGRVGGHEGPQFSLVDGGLALGEAPVLGRCLSAVEASEHPRLAEFWELVDWLVLNDAVLHDFVFRSS